MYTVQAVLARLNQDWTSIDFTTVTIKSLLSTYSSVLLTLLQTGSTIPQQYNLQSIYNIGILAGNSTLVSFLSTYSGVMPTPITPIKTLANAKHINYGSVWAYGLNANRGTFGYTVITDPSIYQPDIVLTPSSSFNNSLPSLIDSLLFTVNGKVFFPTIESESLYLIGAGNQLDLYGSQHIGVIDFSAVGSFTNIPLTSGNTSVFSSSATDKVIYITVPGGLAGFTPVLVLDGNLHVLDNKYSVVSNTQIAVKINYKSLLSDLLNIPANDVTWVEPANLDGTGYNISSINVLTMLASGNSAVLLVPTTSLSVKVTNLIPSGFVGKYKAASVPTGVMYLADGGIGEYDVTNITDYGIEISAASPKLLKALKYQSKEGLTTGINNASLALTSDLSNAVIKDFYII